MSSIARTKWPKSGRDNERRAAILRWWEPTLIPGLLQTEAYARTVISSGRHTPDQIDELVRIRLERQVEALDRQDPVLLSTIIGEPALRSRASDHLLWVRESSHQRPSMIVACPAVLNRRISRLRAWSWASRPVATAPSLGRQRDVSPNDQHRPGARQFG